MALHSKMPSSQEILSDISRIQGYFNLEKIEDQIERALFEFQKDISQKCQEIKERLLDSLKDNSEIKRFTQELENQRAFALTISQSFEESKKLSEQQEERKNRLQKMLRKAVQELIYQGDGIQFLMDENVFSKDSYLFRSIEENVKIRVTLKRKSSLVKIKEDKEELKESPSNYKSRVNPFEPSSIFKSNLEKKQETEENEIHLGGQKRKKSVSFFLPVSSSNSQQTKSIFKKN